MVTVEQIVGLAFEMFIRHFQEQQLMLLSPALEASFLGKEKAVSLHVLEWPTRSVDFTTPELGGLSCIHCHRLTFGEEGISLLASKTVSLKKDVN